MQLIPSGWMRQLYIDIDNLKKYNKYPDVVEITELFTYLQNNDYIVKYMSSCSNDKNEDEDKDKNKAIKSFRYLKHSFLVVQPDEELNNDENVAIVDPKFKEQFEIARPTPEYLEILKDVPNIFIGTKKQLFNTILFIVQASHISFFTSGLHIPPWRKEQSVLSKWRSVL